jgi:hypothetical protein
LTQFDGNALSYITNIDTRNFKSPNRALAAVYHGSPIVFHDKLYLSYGGQLARFDGDVVTFIPNPAGMLPTDGYLGGPFIANDRLYLKYSIGGTRFGNFSNGAVLAYLNETGRPASAAQAAPAPPAPARASPLSTPPAPSTPASSTPAAPPAQATDVKPASISRDGEQWSVSFTDESGKNQISKIVRPSIVNFTPQIWQNLNTQRVGEGMWLAPVATEDKVRIVNVTTRLNGPKYSVDRITISPPVTMGQVAEFVKAYGFQLNPGPAPK